MSETTQEPAIVGRGLSKVYGVNDTVNDTVDEAAEVAHA